MKRLLAGFIGVVLTASAACAQAPFADVPRDHWAYDAVNTLAQRGLVIGYPDGTFGGKRAMTRYEFAVVIARMLPQLEQYIQSEVAKATANIKPGNTTPPELPPDLVRQGDLAGYATKGDVDALRRLIEEFGPELRLLRVDVDLLKKELADLGDRVTALEQEVGRVKVTGTMDVIARMSATDRGTLDNTAGITVLDLDGRSINRFTNLFEWSQMLYNLNLGISGRVTDKIKANTILSVGNYNSFAAAPFFPNEAGVYPPFDRGIFPWGTLNSGSAAAEFGVYKAYIEAPLLGAKTEAGRTGVQFTPLTLKQVDYDLYTDLPHLDNGDVIFTGAKADFKLGPISVLGYAGTHGTSLLTGGSTSGQFTVQGGYPVIFGGGVYTPVAPFSYARDGSIVETVPEALFRDLPYIVAPATQSAGVHMGIGIPWKGTLGATYMSAGINNAFLFNGPDVDAGDVSHASVWGADLTLSPFKAVGLSAEYANSDMFERGQKWTVNPDKSLITRDSLTTAWNAKGTLKVGRNISLGAGWQEVQPYFGAPGDWGRIGTWKNPTNIQGFRGDLNWMLAKGLSFAGFWGDYESIVSGNGVFDAEYDPDNVLRESDRAKLKSWGAEARFTSGIGLFNAGVEWVGTKPGEDVNPSRAEARQTFINFGYGLKLNDASSIRLTYQILDYKDRGAGFLYGGEDAKGSVAIGQFTVKF